MTCDKCGGRLRVYAPRHEPPENHYEECLNCGHKSFLADDDLEYDDEH